MHLTYFIFVSDIIFYEFSKRIDFRVMRNRQITLNDGYNLKLLQIHFTFILDPFWVIRFPRS